MTKLIITRTSEWNNKAREFGIYLNDKKIGVIDDGEKKEFEIEPGIYKINGKIDWCKSQKIEFNITENESKEIEISGFKYGNIIMPIGLGIMLLFFLIKESQLTFFLLYLCQFSANKISLIEHSFEQANHPDK